MNAAIYVRVSTKDKGQTNENQIREVRAFAERLSYSVYKGVATRKAEGQLSGHSSNNYSQIPTSVVSMSCCSGVWTVLAGKG